MRSMHVELHLYVISQRAVVRGDSRRMCRVACRCSCACFQKKSEACVRSGSSESPLEDRDQNSAGRSCCRFRSRRFWLESRCASDDVRINVPFEETLLCSGAAAGSAMNNVGAALDCSARRQRSVSRAALSGSRRGRRSVGLRLEIRQSGFKAPVNALGASDAA